MKSVYLIWMFLFCFLVLGSSMVCLKLPGETVTVDSLAFYPLSKISLTANDFSNPVIQVQLKDGHHTFIKDSLRSYPVFLSDKDSNNTYVLTNILPNRVTDTTIVATVEYQAFDKSIQFASSKAYRVGNISFPLPAIKSFQVDNDFYYKKNMIHKK